MAGAAEPTDVVYTWVDDTWPGYLDALNAHAGDRRDTNPNRTRDNLDLIRYSLRSLARHLPWVRRIYLFTARPQVPPWLDAAHPKLRLVHHDQVIAADNLPTFSSFAIASHLHRLPGVSRRFLYFEDDMMANSPRLWQALCDPDGRPVVNTRRAWILPRDKLNPATSSPWNLAMANADAALSARFGARARRHVMHGPQLWDRDTAAAAEAEFPALFAATRRARFRSADGVPPEVFLAHYAVETGRARLAAPAAARRAEGYVSLENLLPWTWAQLALLDLRRPLSITMNDSFGGRPNARVEALVRRWLQARFPDPAPWERPRAD